MYYEVHGSGDPVLVMGGWGTYCHGGERNLARGLTERYSVVVFDYRGIGACICQEIAITRPDLARSLVNMGAWCHVDDFLRDQLEMFRWLHRELGFLAFQKAVTLMSFDAEFYNENKSRLLGENGGWKELNGRYATHSRLIDACVGYESRSRLGRIQCPALIILAGQDQVTSPRVTVPIERGIPNAIGVKMPDVAHVVAGKDQKRRFCEILLPFLAAN